MNPSNFFNHILDHLPYEQVDEIVNHRSVRIERIVSKGHSSETDFWYDQSENEFVMVLEGHAIIEFEDHQVELKKGDYIDIKAHVKHRVKYTSTNEPTIWLAVFY